MLKKVVAAAAATGGLVLAGAGMAVADSGAQGAAVHSPGVLSGNVVQVPVHVPVNVCGNTVDVVGVLNPAMGNACANQGGGASGGHGGHGGHGGYGDSGARAGRTAAPTRAVTPRTRRASAPATTSRCRSTCR